MIRFLSSILLFLPLASSAANSCIDINAAPAGELEKIKHIGPSRAEQIIKLRQEKLFLSVDGLEDVNGIGPSRISDIKKQGLACVDEKSAAPTTTPLAAPSDPKRNLAEIKPEKPFNSPILLLTALIIAIFSGFAILLLRFFLKKNKREQLCQGILTQKP